MKAVVMKVAAAEAAGEIGPWEEMDSPDELMTAPPHLPQEWIQAHQTWLEQQKQQQQEEGNGRTSSGAAATTSSSSRGSVTSSSLVTSSSHQEQQQVSGSSSLKGSKPGFAGGAHVGCACHGSSGGEGQQQQQEEEAGSTIPSKGDKGNKQSSSSAAAATANGTHASTQAADDKTRSTCSTSGTSSNSSSGGPSGLPPMLAPGVISQRHYPHLQATELLLVNGMRLCLKETDFFKDEVLISGVATGGLSEVRRGGEMCYCIHRS